MTSAAALTTIAIARYVHRLRRVFLLLDAIGLVVFTLIGCHVADRLEEPALIVVVAGMITGCAGGVFRDVLCNDVPLLLRTELYASVSVITGSLYVIGLRAGVPHTPLILIAMTVGLTIRILALRYGWNMPRFVYDESRYRSSEWSDSTSPPISDADRDGSR